MEKYKSMSPAAKIKAGQGLAVLAVQYVLYLCASIALTIATGYYLWEVETDRTCVASNEENGAPTNNSDDNFDVNGRFNDILKIYFAFFITEVVRMVLIVIAVAAKSETLANIYSYGCFNDCLGFAALIILHVYRFQPSGKYCSGDNFRYNGASESDLDDAYDHELAGLHPELQLLKRGRYLLGLVIWVWCGGIGICCVTCICAAICARRG